MSPQAPRKWDHETVLNILWFKAALYHPKLPDAPFEVRPGSTVVDKEKYLARLVEDISYGPGGPRSMTGALQSDLRDLRKLGS